MDRKQKPKEPVKYRNMACRVTSYTDFLQKVQKQNISVASLKHQQSKQSSTPSNGIKTARQMTRCTTESGYMDPRSDHLISKDSSTHTFVSGAFVSVQRDPEWEHPQHNKENTYTQPKSCSRNKSRSKHNTSYDTQLLEPPSKKKMAEAANFLLNELKLIVQSITKFNRQRITYLDYLEVLREFNMIQNNYEPSKQDAVFQLWEVLTAGRENYTCLVNLAIVLLAVMRVAMKTGSVKEFFSSICYSLDEPKTLSHHSKRAVAKEYRRNKEGLIELTLPDVNEIYSNFKQLRVTRMFLGRIGKKSEMLEEKLQRYSSHSFRPHVSNRSRSLAKKKKLRDTSARHLESIEPVEPIVHCLTERAQNEQQECTFQPKTTRNQDERPLSPAAGIRRTQLLYQLGKRKSNQKRDRQQDEIEWEKNREVYTFKPSTTTKCFRKSTEKRQRVQGQGKEVNRMIKARVQKQVTERTIEKGIPYNVKEVNKIRRKITEELMQQMLTKKVSDRFQQGLEQVKRAMNSISEDLSKEDNEIKQAAEIEASKQPKWSAGQTNELSEEEMKGSDGSRVKQNVTVPEDAAFGGLSNIHQEANSKPRRQLFTFEVFLEQDVCLDRITLREGDSPEELAAQFVARHGTACIKEGLKPQMQSKLVKGLYAHLLQLIEQDQLGRIDQQSIEYSVEI